jgi:hypothetical protein
MELFVGWLVGWLVWLCVCLIVFVCVLFVYVLLALLLLLLCARSLISSCVCVVNGVSQSALRRYAYRLNPSWAETQL